MTAKRLQTTVNAVLFVLLLLPPVSAASRWLGYWLTTASLTPLAFVILDALLAGLLIAAAVMVGRRTHGRLMTWVLAAMLVDVAVCAMRPFSLAVLAGGSAALLTGAFVAVHLHPGDRSARQATIITLAMLTLAAAGGSLWVNIVMRGILHHGFSKTDTVLLRTKSPNGFWTLAETNHETGKMRNDYVTVTVHRDLGLLRLARTVYDERLAPKTVRWLDNNTVSVDGRSADMRSWW
jgi:hypothetical protein